eukprot:Opistho-1_new@39673
MHETLHHLSAEVHEIGLEQKAALREAHNAAGGENVDVVIPRSDDALVHVAAERNAKMVEEVVEGGHIAAAGLRRPPLPRVLVEEANLVLHNVRAEPLGQHEHGEAEVFDVRAELFHLRRMKLVLRIRNNERAVLARVKARERLAEHLHKVPALAEGAVEVSEVRVHVIAVPVQRVHLHAQVVAWEVARRVPQAVELVPQHPLAARRRRHYPHGQRHGHRRNEPVALPRRSHFKLDRARHHAVVFKALLQHSEADAEIPRPRPQHIAPSKLDAQNSRASCGRHKHRRARENPGNTHAVQHRDVDVDRERAIIQRLRAVRPRVGALRKIERWRHGTRAGLVVAQPFVCRDEVQTPRAPCTLR